MKKIEKHSSQVDPTWLERLKSDRRIQHFVQLCGQDEAFIEQYAVEFDRWLGAKNLCATCSGLDHCRQPMKGHELFYTYDRDYGLAEGWRPCHFQKKKDQEHDYLKHYVVRDMSIEETLIDFSKLLIPPFSEYASYVGMLTFLVKSTKEKTGAYVYGHPGLGKSYALKSVVNRFVKTEQLKVAFCLFPNLVNRFMGHSYEQRERLLSQLKRVDVLVLDDFGPDRLTRYVLDAFLFPLLDYRMQEKKLTYFSSNYSLDEFGKGLLHQRDLTQVHVDRISERIRVLANPFEVSGNSFR